jgi:hypothetical protein
MQIIWSLFIAGATKNILHHRFNSLFVSDFGLACWTCIEVIGERKRVWKLIDGILNQKYNGGKNFNAWNLIGFKMAHFSTSFPYPSSAA